MTQHASQQSAEFSGAMPVDAPPTLPFGAPPEDWPAIDPSLLDDSRPALPVFPVDVLPSPWKDWAVTAARRAGAPVDYVAQALLAAVAALAGAGVRVSVTPSWSEPLMLWQALVGAASTGKTPALDAVARPLAAVEKALRGHGAEAARPEQGKGAVVVHDFATLTKAVAARPPGVLLWRDEATPWLADLVRQANDTRGGGRWLDAWSARGELAVSIIGSLHPDGLAEAMAGSPDGLPARFLFAWPAPPGHQSLAPADDGVPADDEARKLLQRIAQAVGSPEQPCLLALDSDALMVLDRWLGRLPETARAAEGFDAAWLGKGRGTAVRLSGLLALLDWSRPSATAPVVPRRVMRDHVLAATRLWEGYFHPHARAVLARGLPSDFSLQARRVARWLKSTRRTQVTRTEVRTQGLGKTVNAGRAEALLGNLCALGFVRPLRPETGGRPSERWEVNPALAAA
ncbi:MAG: DUF3987 domain-containing protein [Alphaproteobacteria bacterium]|nr:DUF3987 domain-containing protein [Alphaproteobacteria bacterium]